MQKSGQQLALGPPIHQGTTSLEVAFKQKLYTSKNEVITFGDLFTTRPPSSISVSGDSQQQQVLVIFIRHFFCGNCQEYLRRVIASFPNPLPTYLSIAIVGCGSPSLIESYRLLIPSLPASWPIYADPTTYLYKILGMQRSLSLGTRSPDYIQHNLMSGVVKSIVQGIKRIPQGDALEAGGLSVNGGEYLFELLTGDQQRKWKLIWRHVMMNSRDHTEVSDLMHAVGLTAQAKDGAVEQEQIALSAPIRTQAVSAAQTSRQQARLQAPSSSEKTIAAVAVEQEMSRSGTCAFTPVQVKRKSWTQRMSVFAEGSILGRSAGPPPT